MAQITSLLNKSGDVILLILFIIGTSHPVNAQQLLRIAVAANFAPTLEKLLPEFTLQTNIETQVISSASGVLFQQIKHGAPFDVFLSADKIRPQRLNDENLIVEGSQQTYAFGQIALWSASTELPSLASLMSSSQLNQGSTRLAIANPEIAPYGQAAKAALIALNVWSFYQDKLIVGNNINQTFQQVRSKSVSAGIVANSQLKINNLSGILIPPAYYPAIEQQLVILKSSQHIADAVKFCEFILSQASQEKIASMGYGSVIQTSLSTDLKMSAMSVKAETKG